MRDKKKSFGLIMAVYLLGIFMGALDTGIVTPARTVIQTDLMVDDKLGIWMITIYTLAYAASIPVMGKLADRLGRKYVYLTSIFLFALGSLLCGLSQNAESFTLLLVARAIQAIGGGGIVPVATAEFGTTFPEEKRGMALGMVGGVFGIANIFGASAGSAIMDLFGVHNWQYIFYINIPISAFILIAGFITLPNHKSNQNDKIDVFGITVLIVMVLAFMYGLKNIDFFNFKETIVSLQVYPYLIGFLVLLPIFIFIEKRAADPVMNLSYFTNFRINITLIISTITGVILMGVIFIPQFAENAMKVPSGSGGYFVIILGIFAGVSAPLSGKIIDKYGPKLVLAIGFVASIAGALFMIFVTTNYPTKINVVISLILTGTGMGFTMGTPLNYMMLDNTRPEESNSALATLSLVRSIGTVIAPAIMVGFIAHAGGNIQGDVMKILPNEIEIPQLPYAEELNDEFAKLKKQDQFKDIDIPDLTKMNKVEIKMDGNSDVEIPQKTLELMQSSDVTTIVANTKKFSEDMFKLMTPDIIAQIEDGVNQGIEGMDNAAGEMTKSVTKMTKAYKGMSDGIKGMNEGIKGQESAINQLEKNRTMVVKMENYSSILDIMPEEAKKNLPKEVLGMLGGVKTASQLDQLVAKMEGGLTHLPPQVAEQQKVVIGQLKAMRPTVVKMSNYSSIVDVIPSNVLASMSKDAINQLKGIKTEADLNAKLMELKTGISTLNGKISELEQGRTKLFTGITQLKKAKANMAETKGKMIILRDSVPGAFNNASETYLKAVDSNKSEIENVFQKTLNGGFKQVYGTVAIAGAIGLILLLLYRDKKRIKEHN
ncbi:MAG: MFS transporter [Anaerovoracaceae bacterium]